MLKDYEVIADGVDAPFLATAPTSDAAISDFRLWYAAQYGRHFVGHVWADLVGRAPFEAAAVYGTKLEQLMGRSRVSRSGFVLPDHMADFAAACPPLSVIRAVLIGGDA